MRPPPGLVSTSMAPCWERNATSSSKVMGAPAAGVAEEGARAGGGEPHAAARTQTSGPRYPLPTLVPIFRILASSYSSGTSACSSANERRK